MIGLPFSYFGRPVTVAVHWLASFSVTVLPLDSVTSMWSGRRPSWSSASFHALRIVTSVVSGVWTLVSVVIAPLVTWVEI